MLKNTLPAVSVVMISYNHARYIAQALEGAVLQKTEFPYEIVIGDDCSADGTREIIKRYAENYPGMIRPILHERNVGVLENLRGVLAACAGRYLAFCEGDDYWTNDGKLQIQYDFLERNPNYGGCSHFSDVYLEAKETFRRSRMIKRRIVYSQRDFVLGMMRETRTCTLMLRRNPFVESFLRLDLTGITAIDKVNRILSTEAAKFYVIPLTMAVYRVHPSGLWGKKSPQEREITKRRDIVRFAELFGEKWRPWFEFKIMLKERRHQNPILNILLRGAWFARHPIITAYYSYKRTRTRIRRRWFRIWRPEDKSIQ